MGKMRTVITGTADGQLKIERESRVGIGGSSTDRRKAVRAGIEETWRVTDRVIARDSSQLPAKASGWPGTQNLQPFNANLHIAAENAINTSNFLARAEYEVRAIEIHNANFVIVPPRKAYLSWAYDLPEAANAPAL